MHVEFLDMGNRISFPSKLVKLGDFEVLGKGYHCDGFVEQIRENTLKLESFRFIAFFDYLKSILHVFPFTIDGLDWWCPRVGAPNS